MLPLLPLDNEIRVWRLSLDLPPNLLACCKAVLAEGERRRISRLQRPGHRRRAVAARGQLRWLLARGLGVAPQTLSFGREPHGKPYLPDHPLRFNLSHSGDCLLVALAWDGRLGVDVEQVRVLPRMAALAGRCFAPQEYQTWQAAGARADDFFRLWTLKEAFVKADGRGLALGLERCRFDLHPPRLVAAPPDCGRVAAWQVHAWSPARGWQAALCVHGGGGRLVTGTLAPERLLSGAQAAAGEGVEDGGGAFEAAERAGDWQ